MDSARASSIFIARRFSNRILNIITKEEAQARIPELESVCKVRATPAMLGELAAYYFTLDNPEAALPLAKRASEYIKDSSIFMNLALIHKDLGNHRDAARAVEEAYFLADQHDYYTRLGMAEGLLRAGLWKQAWPIYDNARPTQRGAALDLRLPAGVKEWNGEPLPDGHKLLVINEGGTGDRLSYARFLPRLTELGIDWVFYPYAELFPFFERIFPREKLLKDDDPITATHWTTTFSLPAKLCIGPNEIPPPLPIGPSPEALEKYKLSSSDGSPMIGICYTAAEKFQGGRLVRSMSEGQAMRLVCMTANKVHWVSVQHKTPMPYPVTNVNFDSWDDTAGLIANLDGLVTVDTGTFHLAGCIGKPMAVTLTSNSCWKFLQGSGLSRPKCVWYPNARLYRNEGAGKGIEHSIDLLIQDIRNGVWPSCPQG